MQKSTTTIYASFVSLRARHYMTTESVAPCPWIDTRYVKLKVVKLNLKTMTLVIHSLFTKKSDGRVGKLRLCIQEKLCVEQWLIGKVHGQTMAKSICTALRFRRTPNPNATISSQVGEHLRLNRRDDCHILVGMQLNFSQFIWYGLHYPFRFSITLSLSAYLQWGLGTGIDIGPQFALGKISWCKNANKFTSSDTARLNCGSLRRTTDSCPDRGGNVL